MKNAVLVLGYNNTRINDVKKIRVKAQEAVSAITLLCKKDPTDIDYQAADAVIDVGLEASAGNIALINDFCEKNEIKIIGILPFSDQGTQLGASLADKLNLPGANPAKIEAALNKHTFREQESTNTAPNGYVPVNAIKVTSLTELQTAFNNFKDGVFLKPMAEGNSRGCIAIKTLEACEPAWREVEKYLSGGITAERLIQNAQEYSWEHVAGYSWITEKQTTQSQYRAEPQHILPAPITADEAKLISNGTQFMADICGYNGCACHNEIFLSSNKSSVFAVEPNLRPAGGKLWDLSIHAFENFDPWTNWILWATGNVNHEPKPLKQKAFAGMRFISARESGILKDIQIPSLSELPASSHGDYIELVWTKKTGDAVTANIRDNADFVGYITAKSNNYESLVTLLTQTENNLANACVIQSIT